MSKLTTHLQICSMGIGVDKHFQVRKAFSKVYIDGDYEILQLDSEDTTKVFKDIKAAKGYFVLAEPKHKTFSRVLTYSEVQELCGHNDDAWLQEDAEMDVLKFFEERHGYREEYSDD